MCDSPWTLLESATQAMKSRQGDNVEFVLWTGYAPIFIYTNSIHVNCERRHTETQSAYAKQAIVFFSLWQIAARHSTVLRWPFTRHAFTHTTVRAVPCIYKILNGELLRVAAKYTRFNLHFRVVHTYFIVIPTVIRPVHIYYEPHTHTHSENE